MTKEKAIEYNKNLRMYMKISDKNQPYKFLEENYIALDMAIKSLEADRKIEKILYDIRNEITMLFIFAREPVIEIIDKYLSEVSE